MRRARAAVAGVAVAAVAALGGCAGLPDRPPAVPPAAGTLAAAAGQATSQVATVQAPAAPAQTASAQAVQQLSGRLHLRVHQPRNGATDGGSLVFDFEGNTDQGRLVLQTVIGTAVATARWNAQGAEIVTPRGRQVGATLDDVATVLLGQSLPLAALLHWIQAEPWPQAAHRRDAEGFEQLGWTVSLQAWHERVVTAHRRARADRPDDVDITVRARLDDPAGAVDPAAPTPPTEPAPNRR